MRRVLYVTGTRSDYELMRSTLVAINNDKNLVLDLVITWSHTQEERTINNVRETFNVLQSQVIKTINPGVLLSRLDDYIKKNKPDLVLIEGDRIEALVTAVAATNNNVPIFHLSGGDVSGSRDDNIRHAITKLSHIHLPGTKKSAERIRLLGEESWRIKIVGHMMNKETVSKKELDKFIGFKVDKKTIIVLQHPVTTQAEKAYEQMMETLRAVFSLTNEYQTVIIYPNNDPGSEGIIRAINTFDDSLYHGHYVKTSTAVFRNIPGKIFSTLMKYSGVMVGNSSAGITEAPYWGLPVVNVGSRQEGRERANNVWDREHNVNSITQALKGAFRYRGWSKIVNPYNPSGVERNIVSVLKKIPLDDKLLQKRMTF